MTDKVKLTTEQLRVLKRMSTTHLRVRFESLEAQEAVCQLDGMGYAAAYQDAGHSLGLIWGQITPLGLSLIGGGE